MMYCMLYHTFTSVSRFVYEVYMCISGLDGGEEDDTVAGSGINKKRRRAWELWSMEVKNIFFESINECGKDFEAIQVKDFVESECSREVFFFFFFLTIFLYH